MEYHDIDDVIQAQGLRLILLRGFPSPWGQAAKAMMEFKHLSYRVGALVSRGENAAVVAWAGINSAPVVAWNKEAPVNRWDDILLLLERLAPGAPLVPAELTQKVQFYGLAHAMCAPGGFGWNRRLDMIHGSVTAGAEPGPFGTKYGYSPEDGARAGARSIEFMKLLAQQLKRQADSGSPFIVGDQVTAVDFYWAAFSNLVAIQPPEVCPLDASIRPMFEAVAPAVAEAVDPVLLAHRDHIMDTYFKVPMEL